LFGASTGYSRLTRNGRSAGGISPPNCEVAAQCIWQPPVLSAAWRASGKGVSKTSKIISVVVEHYEIIKSFRKALGHKILTSQIRLVVMMINA
jgi:hypothetical protein